MTTPPPPYPRRTHNATGRPRKPGPPTYAAVHARLRNDIGFASEFPCVSCGGPAREWAYDHQCPNELTETNVLGTELRYSADLDRYRAMCRLCHRGHDCRRPR
jgi:hypothetical protein